MIRRESMQRLYSAAGEALHCLLRLGDAVWVDVDRFEARPAADLDDHLHDSRDVVLAIAIGPGKLLARLAPEEASALIADLSLALDTGRRAAPGDRGSGPARPVFDRAQE